MKTIEKLISEQIERWERQHGAWVPSPESTQPVSAHPVIAISPQLGCGSRLVTRILSKRTGYEIYGFRMIDKVAENMNVRRQLIDRLDQRLKSYTRNLIEGILSGRVVEQREYFEHLIEVIEVFILEGGCILLGRGAPYMVKPGEGLRVRLTAPQETRIINLMNFYKISAREAEGRLEESDRERAEFSQKFYGKDIDDPNNYDLVINMERETPETTTNTILRGLEVMLSQPAEATFRSEYKPEDPEVLVTRQIGKWEHDREMLPTEVWEEMTGEGGQGSTLGRSPALAFQPRFCSGSRLVSEAISERLGYEIFGYRLIDRIAEDMRLSPRIIDRLDQRAKSSIQSMLEDMKAGHRVSREDYFNSLVRVVRAMVVQGSIILVGRGSPFLVEPLEGLRVHITAPMENRLKNMNAFYGIEREEAEDRLKKGDKERREFVQRYFNVDMFDPNQYDITLNLERLTPKSAADIVLKALEPLQV